MCRLTWQRDAQAPLLPLRRWLMPELHGQHPSKQPARSVLHLGCLTGGFTLRLADSARQQGQQISITAVEAHPLLVAACRFHTRWYPEITVIEATHWPLVELSAHDAVCVSHIPGRLSPAIRAGWLQCLMDALPRQQVLCWHSQPRPWWQRINLWPDRPVQLACLLQPGWRAQPDHLPGLRIQPLLRAGNLCCIQASAPV